jgi:hypothetical protein
MCLIIDINKPITAVDVNKLNLTNKEVRKWT